MSGLLAKAALFITAAGLLLGMVTMNGRVIEPLDLGPVVHRPQHVVQRSDLLVVLPTRLNR